MINFGSINSGPINGAGSSAAVRLGLVGACGATAIVSVIKITPLGVVAATCVASTGTASWNRVRTLSLLATCGVSSAYVDPEDGNEITVGAVCRPTVSASVTLSCNCIDSIDANAGASTIATAVRTVPFTIAATLRCVTQDIDQFEGFVPLAGTAHASASTTATVIKVVTAPFTATASATAVVKATASYVDSCVATAGADAEVTFIRNLRIDIAATAGATTADSNGAIVYVIARASPCLVGASTTVDAFINLNSAVPSDRIVFVPYNDRVVRIPYQNRTVYIYG